MNSKLICVPDLIKKKKVFEYIPWIERGKSGRTKKAKQVMILNTYTYMFLGSAEGYLLTTTLRHS